MPRPVPERDGRDAMVGQVQIRLRDVSFSYPRAENNSPSALRNVSLDICAGEHVCVLGSNGSGKSTLIQLMNALLAPDAGSVEVFGITSTGEDEAFAIRGRVSMVFQHPDDQMVTSIVADDVAFGPENLGVPQPEIVRRVDAALRAVNLAAFAQADPDDLSGGQQQRVAIAGALAMQPEVLLLDEPSAMLDTDGHREILRIVEDLATRGVTIVHVTHFMEDALRADRVIVLDRGRIALDGAPGDVFARREEISALGLELPFTQELIDALSSRGVAVPGIDMDVDSLACSLAARLSKTGSKSGVSRAETQLAASTETRTATCRRAVQDDRPMAIDFENVSFSYENPRNPRRRRLRGHRAPDSLRVPLALDKVSFTVARGSLTALIGHTGSGKSTAVELACALKVPLSGTVRIEGVDTADLDRRCEIRRLIGYVSQMPERQLFAQTVFEDVAFGPRNLGLSADEIDHRVHEALEAAGIADADDMLDRSPFALSGGQQRAVAIAGVLAMRSPVLVLDEPMAGLDPGGRRRMRALLRRLRASGSTLLLVTHSMDDVAQLADDVIVLEAGRCRKQGTPADIFIEDDVGLGLPAPLDFARRLIDHGASSIGTPLTLDELVTEVAHGLAL